MASSTNRISDLLANVSLHDKTLIEQEVTQLLNHSQSNLAFKIMPYYHENGQQDELPCLTGTIQTKYRGVTYNTPIEICLPKDYPTSPPICFVRPTGNMYIAQSCPFVNQDGRILMDYVFRWIPSRPQLIEFIDSLTFLFGEKPPLYTGASKYPTQSIKGHTIVDRSQLVTTYNEKCNICLTNDLDCVILECGHLYSCSTCSALLTDCPVCRTRIVRIKKIYRA